MLTYQIPEATVLEERMPELIRRFAYSMQATYQKALKEVLEPGSDIEPEGIAMLIAKIANAFKGDNLSMMSVFMMAPSLVNVMFSDAPQEWKSKAIEFVRIAKDSKSS